MNKIICKATQFVLGCFFVIIFGKQTSAQNNLVPNYSFENIIDLNIHLSEINKANPWFGPFINTSDLFHLNSLDSITRPPFLTSLTPNFYQYPRTGLAMAGISTMCQGYGYNYRTNIAVPLIDSLKFNKCYLVYFYVNFNNSNYYSTNNIALSFSDTTFRTDKLPTDTNSVINIPSNVLKQGNPIISDTEKWTPIAGIYTANGGEKYVVIGNFKNDILTDTLSISSQYFQACSYYFIDDVYVLEADAYAGNDTNIIIGDSVYLGIEQIPGLQNNWYSNNQLIKQSQGGIWVKPTTTTTYVLESIICGTTYYDTVVVHVSTGINQLANSNKNLEVSPNPSNSSFSITSNLPQQLQISILSIDGKLLVKEKTEANSLINASLNDGIYILIIEEELTHTKSIKKLIIQTNE